MPNDGLLFDPNDIKPIQGAYDAPAPPSPPEPESRLQVGNLQALISGAKLKKLPEVVPLNPVGDAERVRAGLGVAPPIQAEPPPQTQQPAPGVSSGPVVQSTPQRAQPKPRPRLQGGQFLALAGLRRANPSKADQWVKDNFGHVSGMPRNQEELTEQLKSAFMSGEIPATMYDEVSAGAREALDGYLNTSQGIQRERFFNKTDGMEAERGFIETAAHEQLGIEEDRRRLIDQRQGALANDEAARQDLQERYAAKREEQLRSYEQGVQELSDFQFDPDKYDSSASSWRSRIAAFFFAAGGRPDIAANLVNAQMKQAMQGQAMEQGAKKASLDGKRSILQVMRQNFGDDQLALAATEKFHLQNYRAEVEKLGSRSTDAKVQANSRLLLGELDTQIRDRELMLEQSAAQQAEYEQELERRRQMAAIYAAQQRQRAALEAQSPGLGAVADERLVFKDLEGKYRVAADPTEAQNLRKGVVASQNLTKLLDDARSKFKALGGYDKTFGKVYDYSGDLAAANNSRVELLMALKNLEQSGAIDSGTIELFENRFPNAGSIFTTEAEIDKTMDATLDSIQRDIKSKVSAQAIPGREVITGPDGLLRYANGMPAPLAQQRADPRDKIDTRERTRQYREGRRHAR